MATVAKTCDVFITHTGADRRIAAQIAERLELAGLESFHGGTLTPEMDIGDAIWEALAESRAVIVITSPNAPPQAMGMVEIGAAAAWNKLVLVVINGPSSTKLPAGLKTFPVFPITRLDEVIHQIQASFEPLDDRERGVLAELYGDQKTTTDRLSQSPKALRELTAAFNRKVGRQFSGERVLSELIRMRKRGGLRKIRSLS